MAAQQPARHAAPPMQAVIMPRPVKVHLPDLFDGSRQQLSSFFGQLALYFGFHTDQFPADQPEKKILFATTLMRGSAYEWFEGYLDDYLESPNDETQREDETNEIFQSYEVFKEKLTQTFGDLDKKRAAERKIMALRQMTSVGEYTAQFQKYASKTKWDEDALMAQYYRGLKDEVKDDYVRINPAPETLHEMIEAATKIDTRLYERKLERKGNYQPRFGARTQSRTHRPHYGLQPMELDSTQRHKTLSKQEKERRYKDKLCLYCGKPGHFAKDCRSKRQANQAEAKPKATPRQTGAARGGHRRPATARTIHVLERIPTPSPDVSDTTEEFEELRIESEEEKSDEELLEVYLTPEEGETKTEIPTSSTNDTINIWTEDTAWRRHVSLHWSACYNEYCTIHESNKMFQPRPKTNQHCTEWRWTSCTNDDCERHIEAKIWNEWFPQEMIGPACYVSYWTKCRQTKCAKHLIEKRERRSFPGRKATLLWNQFKTQTFNECNQGPWYYCFAPRCKKHLADKLRNGYMPNEHPKNF